MLGNTTKHTRPRNWKLSSAGSVTHVLIDLPASYVYLKRPTLCYATQYFQSYVSQEKAKSPKSEMTFTNKAYLDKQSELELVRQKSTGIPCNLLWHERKQALFSKLENNPMTFRSELRKLQHQAMTDSEHFWLLLGALGFFPTSPERRLRNPSQSVFPNVKVALPSCFLSASSRSLSFRASYFLSKALINSWSEPVPSYSNNTTATFSTTPSWRSWSCFCFKAASSSWL